MPAIDHFCFGSCYSPFERAPAGFKFQISATVQRVSFSNTIDDASGPDLPFASWLSAAVQLHQTRHSSIVQHFRGAKVGTAGQSQ